VGQRARRAACFRSVFSVPPWSDLLTFLLEQAGLLDGVRIWFAEMLIGAACGDAAAWGAIQETELDPAGKKIKVSEYRYANNLKTEKTVYDGNGQVLSKKTYKYETY